MVAGIKSLQQYAYGLADELKLLFYFEGPQY